MDIVLAFPHFRDALDSEWEPPDGSPQREPFWHCSSLRFRTKRSDIGAPPGRSVLLSHGAHFWFSAPPSDSHTGAVRMQGEEGKQQFLPFRGSFCRSEHFRSVPTLRRSRPVVPYAIAAYWSLPQRPPVRPPRLW